MTVQQLINKLQKLPATQEIQIVGINEFNETTDYDYEIFPIDHISQFEIVGCNPSILLFPKGWMTKACVNRFKTKDIVDSKGNLLYSRKLTKL